MPEIKIRNADFARTYADIHSVCFAHGWNESTMRQMLLMPGAVGLIAYEREKPVGIVLYAYSPEQADIVTFGILPDYRGKHVSDKLMDKSFAFLKEKGIKEIFLEVAVDNEHAIALYRRHGFEQVGRRSNYYVRGDVKTDALVMRVDL
ncbi:MAG: ribosomal protein S18-alanine N-acetyltransferase [Alphaproteobacteria bacterium]|nr:ribosomal protein S18-alanine N-acetyltransferase [Alphaproteobacteria bacterium]